MRDAKSIHDLIKRKDPGFHSGLMSGHTGEERKTRVGVKSKSTKRYDLHCDERNKELRRRVLSRTHALGNVTCNGDSLRSSQTPF